MRRLTALPVSDRGTSRLAAREPRLRTASADTDSSQILFVTGGATTAPRRSTGQASGLLVSTSPQRATTPTGAARSSQAAAATTSSGPAARLSRRVPGLVVAPLSATGQLASRSSSPNRHEPRLAQKPPAHQRRRLFCA